MESVLFYLEFEIVYLQQECGSSRLDGIECWQLMLGNLLLEVQIFCKSYCRNFFICKNQMVIRLYDHLLNKQ